MANELETRWIAALRSGEYKQCTGQLHKGDSYCCLGVLAKIAGAEFIQTGERVKYKEQVAKPATSYGIPDSLMEETNILDYKTIMDLVSMNDREKKSFNEIADYIEYKSNNIEAEATSTPKT